MKKSVVIILVMLFLCIFSCLLTYVILQGGPAKLLKRLFQPGNIIVLVDRGFVYYKESKEDKYKVAKDEEELYEGYWVKTDRGSEAHLVFKDNTMVTLDEETELQIESVATKDSEKTVLKQFLGATWHRIQNLAGSDYEIVTPNGVAAVRGTIFAVRGADFAEIFVIENDVDVTQNNAKGKRGVKDTLGENDYTIVNDVANESGFTVLPIPEELKVDRWFTHNRELDELYKEMLKDGDIDRDAFIDRFREEKPKLSALDLIKNPDKAAKELEDISTVRSGDESYCEFLYSIDVALITEVISYGDNFLDTGISSSQFKAFFFDMLDACDNDGVIDDVEYEAIQGRYEFLSE